MVWGGTASGGKKTKERRKDTISSACASPLVRAQSSGQVLRSYRCRWNPRARAQSWIILPKGIFIGRECMQKRGHRHKGAADLALTQLREWTHTWIQNRAVESARLRVMDCPTFLSLLLPSSFLCVDSFPPLADGASSLYRYILLK